jgi:two-component system CheB/CheR fusion protein
MIHSQVIIMIWPEESMGRADAIPSNAEPGVSPQTIDTPEAGAAPAAERAEPQDPAGPALFVVGIGASAGGLEALRPFVANLPIQSNMAYIVAQHLSPQHRSMMVQLLGRETALPVVEAADGMMIEADTIYVTPPNRDAAVCDDGRLSLRRPSAEIGPKPSINHLFASLARTQGERAVGVILSGTGSETALTACAPSRRPAALRWRRSRARPSTT